MAVKNKEIHPTIIGGTTRTAETSVISTFVKNSTYGAFKYVNQHIEACKTLFYSKMIDSERAASLIVAEMRSHYISKMQTGNDCITVDALQYIDQILFNDMRYLVNSILQYGPNDDIKNVMKRAVDNTLSIIEEYNLSDEDKETLYNMIDEVCRI